MDAEFLLNSVFHPSVFQKLKNVWLVTFFDFEIILLCIKEEFIWLKGKDKINIFIFFVLRSFLGFFYRILKYKIKKNVKEQHLFEIQIFCKIIEVFTVILKYNCVSLLHKSISFLKKRPLVYVHILQKYDFVTTNLYY